MAGTAKISVLQRVRLGRMMFCQPDWKGLNDKAQEIPLRPFLERLAKGQSQHSAVVMLHRTDKLALGLDLDLDRLSSIDE